MKQLNMKRTLLVVAVCGFLFIFFFWNQTPGPPNPISHMTRVLKKIIRPASDNDKSTSTLWTWECRNKRCEKIETIDEKQKKMSLETCNMICGSPQLWPQPTGPLTLGTRYVKFNHRQIIYQTNAIEQSKRLLDRVFSIFQENVAKILPTAEKVDNSTTLTDINNFIIKISLINTSINKLILETNESYNLTVKLQTNADLLVKINAGNFFGARHGLETLSQLIWSEDGHLVILKSVKIEDKPKLPYRGILLDTARNFIPLDGIKRMLDGMAANKLNAFHWHMTDSQSFPFAITELPLLAKYGAYSEEMTYNEDDVKNVVDYARVRGIRVIIEVDTPAHAGNGWTWGPDQGLGELAVCVNARPWSLYCGEPPCGQLNPHNPNVYDLLEKIYASIINATEETELFHIGGDEVNLECWQQYLPTSTVTNSNYTDLHDLWGEFTVKAIKKIKKSNLKHIIIWSSNLTKRPYLTKYLNKENIVVQSWGSSQWPDTPELLSEGYKVIISHVDAWYLDCGFGRWRETGDAACDPYRPWQTMYNHQPWTDITMGKQILGGEACLWSEQVDVASLDTRLWPRAAAFAERLWTDPVVNNNNNEYYVIPEDVYTRLTKQRERLINRGLKCEALWPMWCTENPGMCL